MLRRYLERTVRNSSVSLSVVSHTFFRQSHIMDRVGQDALTRLQGWSCTDGKPLPPRDSIDSIHVYDFDNTLFSSPLPNRQLWASQSISKLQTQEAFVGGGWWHDSSILASTGRGLDEEEPRAWAGHWNEQIVQLVELSMAQQDALTVLLTGRSEAEFAQLIQRIVSSRRLNFDLIVLKPGADADGNKYESTMTFKQTFLGTLLSTYTTATTLRLYEDRPKHTKAFRTFFEDFNTSLLTTSQHQYTEGNPRKPIEAEVVQVTEDAACLDATVEIATVQRMINIHNAAIKSGTAGSSYRPMKLHRNVFFTAYLIPPESSKALCDLVKFPAGLHSASRSEINMLGNSILIAPRPADSHLLMRVGGLGHKVQWRVTGLACYDKRIWAAKVTPVNTQERVFTHSRPAHVVLALKKGSKPAEADRIQNWQSVGGDEALMFDTTVGEKVQLRIDEDTKSGGSEQGGHQIPSSSGRNGAAGRGSGNDGSPPTKKPRTREQDFIPIAGYASAPNDDEVRPRPAAISANQGTRQGGGPRKRGGGGGPRGQARSGGNGPGARNGPPSHGYRSLDDMNGGRQVRGYADFDGGSQGGHTERQMDY